MNTATGRSDTALPLVSILVPCYNSEAWVAECIESALRQSYPNKEVIVVDDGSTDASAEVIRRFGDRITFRIVANAGANAARNYLTSLARGEWLQYLDADDYLLPGKIASQIDLLGTQARGADVIYSPVIMHDTSRPGGNYTIRIEADDETLNFIRWSSFSTHSTLFRRQAVLAVGGWKEDQPCCQEHELILRLLLAGSRFILSPEPGAVYRKHGPNTITTRDPMRVVRIRMSLTNRFEQHLRSAGMLNAKHRAALFVARMEAARSAFYMGHRETAEEYSSKALENGQYWSEYSNALPWYYRLAVQLLGFKVTELIALRIRRESLPASSNDRSVHDRH
jgi:glycosyltransferase involved in cell wall biosynthesis